MPQEIRRRWHTTINYSSGQRVSEQLSKGAMLRELYLRLKGAPTLTAANNTQAKTKKGDEFAILKRVDLIANGGDAIRSFTGEELWWLQRFLYGTLPDVTPAIGDATTANPSFDSTLILPLWMPGTIRPMDTILDTSNLSSLTLDVTWGAFTDLNADASAWTTNPTLDVYALESFVPRGENIQIVSSPSRVTRLVETISGANAAYAVRLPLGWVHRSLLVNVVASGADAAPYGSLIEVDHGFFRVFRPTLLGFELPLSASRLEISDTGGNWLELRQNEVANIDISRLTSEADLPGYVQVRLNERTWRFLINQPGPNNQIIRGIPMVPGTRAATNPEVTAPIAAAATSAARWLAIGSLLLAGLYVYTLARR